LYICILTMTAAGHISDDKAASPVQSCVYLTCPR